MTSPTTGLTEVLALRQDLLARSEALRAVRAASETSSASGGAIAAAVPGTPSVDFAQTLQGALKEVSAVQKRSADMQAGYERGEVTDIAQVMLAREEAGIAFEATLQVRNKLLSAYQEIMRMGA
ncbi:MAG: flagellar hook-basal body complex protein FliE [Erythrobacter sp.]|uniref:flagellar hook-basal body complex protein FliE n=1 Tax=Erythrobacter sp. TaxID=1042 RepID=UPI0026060180|nr:flagellar hook-basal body complex protein FliE [Erythrobacter sp.]MDJ0979142.1 flagellar hook-basal body complex protein FliE [Erythrobacter sp.]